jgi:hypothetical protein
MSNSPMPESVINEALDVIFNGRKKYTGFRTRMEKHEYVVDESDQQAFEQWVEQREREIENGREV